MSRYRETVKYLAPIIDWVNETLNTHFYTPHINNNMVYSNWSKFMIFHYVTEPHLLRFHAVGCLKEEVVDLEEPDSLDVLREWLQKNDPRI